VGEGGLAAQPLGIVAGGHQQASRGDRAHALDGQKFWCCLSHQLAQLQIERLDLNAELLIPAREGLEGKLGRCGRRGER